MDQANGMIKRTTASSFSVRDLRALRAEAINHPRQFAQKVAVTTLDELVARKIKSGDPYSLRWTRKKPPSVVFQLEYDAAVALYAGLNSDELKIYAEALRRCWSLLGIGRGDRVAIFDYGTSPVSYLASSAFTPYLQRGAAEILGCLTICNDGGANLSQRAVDIVRSVRPRVLFLRTDCLHPFAAETERGSMPLSSYLRALIAVENEGFLSTAERDSYQRILGVPIYRLVRADVAMFLAMECPRCGSFHSWRDLYHLETAPQEGGQESAGQAGCLLITNWFAKSCPAIRYLSQVKATLETPGCPAGLEDLRITA